MDLRPLVFFCVCLLTVIYAAKEDASYGSSQSDARKHFIELIKRIGKDNGVDLEDFIRAEETKEQCKTNKITRSSIIKSTESIALGAKYVSSHKKISSVTECSDMCCDNSDCDTAIYQENKDQHCYLFACQGVCKFSEHVDYSVTEIERLKPTPSQQEHEEEAQLENLHGNSEGAVSPEQSEDHQVQDQDASDQEEEVPVTVAPTPAPKPYVAPHTAGLNGFCTSEISCEDPNAGCFDEKCGCRQSYYNKEGLCRKVCLETHFECFKLGSLTRGPECVPKLQVCDSYMQCADGSDELNCEDADNQPAEISHSNTVTKNKGESQGGMPQRPAKNEVMKPRPPMKEEPLASKTKTQAPAVQSSISTQPPAAPSNKTSGVSKSAKVNHTDQATSKPPHHSVGTKEQVFLSREKVIIASSSSEAEGPIIALSLGLAFTIILIGLLACRLRNMKHRLRKGRPLNSNEADYLINGMYL